MAAGKVKSAALVPQIQMAATPNKGDVENSKSHYSFYIFTLSKTRSMFIPKENVHICNIEICIAKIPSKLSIYYYCALTLIISGPTKIIVT